MIKDKVIDVRLSSAELNLLRIRCEQDNITMSQFLRDAILCYCRHQDGVHAKRPDENND